MDKNELSEDEYAARKAASVAYQKKRQFSNIFVLCASIFLVIETMIILLALMIPLFAIFSRLDLSSTAILMLFEVLKMVAFVGGLILGFVVFRGVLNLVIRKYHLEDKLTDNVKSHYLKKTKEEKEMELKK